MTIEDTGIGHTEQVLVQFDDLDPFGAVHHAKVSVLVERASFSIIRRLGFPFGHPDATAVVADLNIQFKTPIAGIGPVDVRMWVDRVGGSSMVDAFEISRGGTTLATGSRTMVKIDTKTMRPAPWGAEFLATLTREGLVTGQRAG